MNKKIMYPLFIHLCVGIFMYISLQIVNVILIEVSREWYSLIVDTFSYRIIFLIAWCLVSVFIYFRLSSKWLKDINRKELLYGMGLLVFINSIVFLLAFLMLNFFEGAYSNQGIFFYTILITFNRGIGGWIDLSWEVVSGIGAYFAVYFSTFIPVSVMVFTWLRNSKLKTLTESS